MTNHSPHSPRGRRRRSVMSRPRRGLYSTGFGEQQVVNRGWSSQRPLLSPYERNTLANAPMDGMPQLKMANQFGGNSGLPSRTASGKIRAIQKAPRPSNFGANAPTGPGKKPAAKGNNKGLLDQETAEGIMKSISMKNNRMRCLAKSSKMNYHDAYFWARAPGESDGRLFPAGSVHKCLLSHGLTCDGSCPLITSVPCTCSGAPPMQQQGWGQPQPGWGYQPNYMPQPQQQLNQWNPQTWGWKLANNCTKTNQIPSVARKFDYEKKILPTAENRQIIPGHSSIAIFTKMNNYKSRRKLK